MDKLIDPAAMFGISGAASSAAARENVAEKRGRLHPAQKQIFVRAMGQGHRLIADS